MKRTIHWILVLDLIIPLCSADGHCTGPVCYVVKELDGRNRQVHKTDCNDDIKYTPAKIIRYRCSSDINVGDLINEMGPTYEPESKDESSMYTPTSNPPSAIPSSAAHDCFDIYNAGNRVNGVYTIFPPGWSGISFDVFCDMTTEEGGWTVFQRRRDGSTNFYRNWTSYKMGFGNLSNEFWLGNDKLHALTNQKNYELRTDLTDNTGKRYYSVNSLFRIGNDSESYVVTDVGNYSGTTVSNQIGELQNKPFSTYDNDNGDPTYNCAEKHRGGWWYGHAGHTNSGNDNCYRWIDGSEHLRCEASNLNGDYNGTRGENIFWLKLADHKGDESCNIKATEMKIRPV